MLEIILSDANEGCPGVDTDKAGKSEACAGCPNQNICSSGAAQQEDPGKYMIYLTNALAL